MHEGFRPLPPSTLRARCTDPAAPGLRVLIRDGRDIHPHAAARAHRQPGYQSPASACRTRRRRGMTVLRVSTSVPSASRPSNSSEHVLPIAAARTNPNSRSALAFHEQFSPLSLTVNGCGGGVLEELEKIAVQHHGGFLFARGSDACASMNGNAICGPRVELTSAPTGVRCRCRGCARRIINSQ